MPTTRPYTPRTNGKAERFVRSSLREWAYAPRPFQTSDDRRAAVQPCLCHYDSQRPYAALCGHPPVSRIARNNLFGSIAWGVGDRRDEARPHPAQLAASGGFDPRRR